MMVMLLASNAALQKRYTTGLSLLATGVVQRLIGAIVLVAGLWLAVAWALH
jgi:hypothetical protein